MVDIIRPKKTWTKKRILTFSGIGALLLLISASIYFTSGKSRLSVDSERLTISTVTKGSFQETIPRNGVVLPYTSIYLDALVGGRVEEKFVDDGTIMKKDDPILRLSNTNLELELVSQQTGVYNNLTQMQIARNAALQNTVTKRTQETDAENSLKEAERIYLLDKHLYEQKVIGSQEFKQAENNYNYQIKKKNLLDQILQQDSVSNEQQLVQAKQTLEGTQKALNIMNKKVGDLILRSPIDGQLTSLNAEIGEQKTQGQRLGQIDVLKSGYKIRVDVDEHYIARIYAGLKGWFSFNNDTFHLKIFKVFAQITGGVFNVDMEFVGKSPQNIRRGQTLQIFLALSDERQAVLVPRGGFFQQTGGNWIFKVAENGKTAYKVDIQLGNQNSDYYEVLQGLNPGDRVVTSSYETYGNMQELVLKKE